uniref:Uncharacterized protein n=1 Tax=Anguilla anguilla TaxID=7936 RepID=A0A0E9WC08_ANGAN
MGFCRESVQSYVLQNFQFE